MDTLRNPVLLKWIRAITGTAILLGLTAARAESQEPRAFTLAFGNTAPEHEPLRRWVLASPRFDAHLLWLSSQLSLPVSVPVMFTTCGQPNAFYNPNLKRIEICYEWLEKRTRQVQTQSSPVPTGEKLTDDVLRSALHVINHEVGHALVNVLNLPVLGREEDAADAFSAFILVERGNPQDAFSVLQGAKSMQPMAFEGQSQADIHSLGQQRFYNLLCWMYGSDPVRFAGYAQDGGLPGERLKWCAHEWAQLEKSWTDELASHLTPRAATAALTSSGGPYEAMIANGNKISIAAGQSWYVRFQVPASNCRLDLRVLGLTGGRMDVVTMVLDEYSFLSWSSRGQQHYEPVYKSAQMRLLDNISIPVKGPGQFALVVGNEFSTFTPKTAEATARLSCPGTGG